MRKRRFPGFNNLQARAPWVMLPPTDAPNNDLIFTGAYSVPGGDEVDLTLR